MRLARLLSLLALCVLEAGCTVMAVSPGTDAQPGNSCSEDSECGSGYSCRTGVCQTLNGELESLLITASPPSDSFLPHLTFVTHLDDVPTGGGSRELVVPAPAQVRAALTLPVGTTCYPAFQDADGETMLAASDGTVPVTVTLALRQRSLGLSQQVYYVKTGAPVGRGYVFRTKVPAGEYDVYFEPPRQKVQTCPAPPQFYQQFPIGISEGDQGQATEITFRMSAISPLKLVLVWPASSPSLEGWVADIIEPSAGNPISTRETLSKPVAQGQTVEYSVPLWSTSVIQGTTTVLDTKGQLLRLRPPAGARAPTIYLDRSAIGLLQTDPTDEVRFTAFSRLPSNVEIHGQLLRQPQGTSVAGTVTLISTEIYGIDPGVFGSYQTTVTADANGLVKLELPPGKYRVHGQPLPWSGGASDDDRLAAAETIWEVAPDLPIQFGKVLELPPLRELGGYSQVPGAMVRAEPSLQKTSPFQIAFGDLPLYPRSSAGLVDDTGRFALRVDPGRFDVTVRAPEGLGYGWYVRPGVAIQDRGLDLSADLRRPSVLTGRATLVLQSGTQPLASAAISAYAYLNKDLAYTRDPEQAVSVVLVAETRADVDGAFRLLLPSSIVTSAR